VGVLFLKEEWMLLQLLTKDFVEIDGLEVSVDVVNCDDMRTFSRHTGWELHKFFADGTIGPLTPAVYVSALDADAFCKWAHLRLPTSKEWDTIRNSGEVRLSGLYEWTQDTTIDSYRVLRGGSWNYDDCTGHFRCAYHRYLAPARRDDYHGFRVVKS